MANDREFSNLTVRLPLEMRRQLEREAAAAERSVAHYGKLKRRHGEIFS
jgi:hypothetical protein